MRTTRTSALTTNLRVPVLDGWKTLGAAGDGKPDIVTSAIFGTFVFFNQLKPQAHTGNN